MDAPPLLPAAIFPPLEWFQLGKQNGAIVCQHENYVKQSLRNRVALVAAQGPVDVSFPVARRTATERSVQSLRFTDRVRPSMLLKAIQTNCGRAPFYEHYFPDVESWAHSYLLPGESWLEAALASTRWSMQMLDWPHPKISESYVGAIGMDDWRPKSRWTNPSSERYPQVFEDRHGFVHGRSILDVLFHVGPEATYLPSPHGNANPPSNSSA